MTAKDFFKDSNGQVVITQRPNWPIWGVIALSLFGRAYIDRPELIDYAISGLLGYWGVLELTKGVNGFRRSLGVLAIGYSIWRLVQ